jgi:hypothetical protein
MTVIVGYTDGKTYSVGGDSGAFEESGLYQTTADAKVWRAGDWLLGGSGSFRIIETAKKSGLGDPFALRDHLKESNAIGDWSLLVVGRKFLFEIDQEFGVLRVKDNYAAIGVANTVAIGALAVLSMNKCDSLNAVKTALNVTARHHVNAVPPFTTLRIES